MVDLSPSDVARELIGTCPDPIVQLDPDQCVLFANDAFCCAFGGTPDCWPGRRFVIGGTQAFSHLVPGKWTELDCRYDRADGPHWYSWHLGVHVSSRGQKTFLAVGRDVTGRKKLEESLRESRLYAEDSVKAKSLFLATMSHEIRTPMNGIIGMASLLIDTKLTPEQQTYCDAVRTSGKVLLDLINDILDYSKIEAGKLELEKGDFDLTKTVQQITELMAPRAYDKGIEIACVIEPDTSVLLEGDEARLRQVILNLATNAVKFTQTGGVILHVSSREHVSKPGQTVLRIEVQDTGIGIAKKMQSHIFDEFSQADQSPSSQYGGTGLGLAICKKIIEAMDGKIGVDSVQGQGSTFWVEVSLELQDTWRTPARADGLFGFKFLIISSSPVVCRAVNAQLAGPGAEISCVGSYDEAVQALKDHVSYPYTTLICDSALPEDGAERLIRYAGQLSAEAPPKSIVLLPPEERKHLDDLLERGFDAYLIKPIRQDSLVARVLAVHGLEVDAVASAQDSEAAERERVARADWPGQRPLRVLLAEDNQINAILTTALVRKAGHHIDTVTNGRDVLEALDGKSYDLILMDMRMPDLDGLETTRIIRSRDDAKGSVPIIGLTANAMEEDRRRCFKAGMDDFLTKPVEALDLTRAMNHWTNTAPIAKVS